MSDVTVLGLVGDLWAANLVDCTVQVQVTGEDEFGGIAGGGLGTDNGRLLLGH